MCLDKDILVKGNKVYSSETCIFVPQKINTLFENRKNCRGDCPIGVTYDKDCNLYRARCNILNNNKQKSKHLGRFKTKIEAFKSYKIFKESYIKQMAEKYKEVIPVELYKAMYNWEVEITD